MDHLSFYSANEVYAETYYQLPKVFFTNDKYKKMSSDTKIAYSLLKHRFNYSIQNNWCDDNNHIYFIYTVKELQEILNCGTEKIAKIKKELEQAELLYQKRIGLKQPNRLYLLKPEATAQDVYLQTDNSKNRTQPLDTKGISKIEIQENGTQPLDTKGISKIENNVYRYNNLDTNRHLIDSEKDQRQNQILLDNFVESCKAKQSPTFIPENVLSLIATFSNTFEEAQKTVQTIHNAKHKAETITGESIAYEEVSDYVDNPDHVLYQTLLRAYQKQKTERVKDLQNLIFAYVKNWFIEQPIARKQQRNSSEKLPKVTLTNWLK